jgi:hypothetical protein
MLRAQQLLAEQPRQQQQLPEPMQVEIVDEEIAGSNDEPTMVTDSIFVDPNEETVLPSLRTILEKTGTNEFDPSNVKLHDHVDMIHAAKKFHEDIFADTKDLFHCAFCKERGPATQQYGNTFECVECFKSRGEDESNVRKFSKENRMDPFPDGYPANLPKLSVIEELLISPVHSTFACYRLPNGQHAFRGQVINLEQKNIAWLQSVPMRVQDLPHVLFVRKSNPNITDAFRDFEVDRNKLLRVLTYLKDSDPTNFGQLRIDYEVLQQLPAGGSVLHLVPQVVEDDTPRTEESDTPTDVDFIETTDIENGPDQCGATGSPNEDAEDRGPLQDYVAQPLERNVNVEDSLRQELFGGTRENPAAWPELGEPVSDYSTPNIQAGAFPTLFPHGVGDATNRDRPKSVTLTDATKHLLWYAIRKDDGSYLYPFAEHERWMYWAQNTCERHRFNSQKRVYLKRSPGPTSLTMEQLQDIVRNNDYNKLREILGRMQMYSSNILGSDACFAKSRIYLEPLVQSKGMPTL